MDDIGVGYASTVIDIGTGYVTRFVTDPPSFLSVGGVLFLATLGLDKFARQLDG